MKNRWFSLAGWLAWSAALVLLDWQTKQVVVERLAGRGPFVIWEGVFELLYSENRGAAFGMLQGRQTFFFLVAVAVFLACFYVVLRLPRSRRFLPLRICIIMLTAGAAGNLIDRVKQGYVVDFLYFRLIDFPIFNVADIFVTVSAALLALLLMFYYKEEELDILKWRQEPGHGSGAGKGSV